jgi:hypothetical protein
MGFFYHFAPRDSLYLYLTPHQAARAKGAVWFCAERYHTGSFSRQGCSIVLELARTLRASPGQLR